MRLICPQTSTPLPKKFFEQSSPPGLSHQIRPRIRSPSHLAPQVAIETKAQSLLFLRRKVARGVRDQREACRMGIREAIASEAFQLPEGAFGKFPRIAVIEHPRDELSLKFVNAACG